MFFFADRTGEVERKRKRRMVRAGVEGGEKKSKTFDMLTKDLVEVWYHTQYSIVIYSSVQLLSCCTHYLVKLYCAS